MYIFGGNDLKFSYGDMWVLDLQGVLVTISAPSTCTTSVPTASHTTVDSVSSFDSNADALSTQSTNTIDDSLSESSAHSLWQQLHFTDTCVKPSDRIGHCTVAIGTRYFLLYGGRDYIRSTMSEGEVTCVVILAVCVHKMCVVFVRLLIVVGGGWDIFVSYLVYIVHIHSCMSI